ncbi:MAG TPA: hypothetical protein PLE74_00165 [Candidatus Cloacimonadota bacterium]|nr:hypothetical protein [Candidatus Cloacimonadota bacterium]HPT70673.1 hypothetical protein [Candidatus Cloacimonadota bacterium]
MPTNAQLRMKLVNKLRELFQLNQPDLDFGFYRIMHAKANQVSDFIENDLLGIIQETFGREDENRKVRLKAVLDQELENARAYGVEEPEKSPKVQEARANYEAAGNSASAESEIYDHLYRFFERYYEDGDFISRRYITRETADKAASYAVPYNGEEIKLHWANADQYYIKTTEYFNNFSFDLVQANKKIIEKSGKDMGQEEFNLEEDLPEKLMVHFKIVDAMEGEHGNIKESDAKKRFFIIHGEKPIEWNDKRELVINFEYRSDEEKNKQENSWRDVKNQEAVQVILQALKKEEQTSGYLQLLTAKTPTENDKNRILLAKYLNHYTARNTMDYFIHKDLGNFLKRELDFLHKERSDASG